MKTISRSGMIILALIIMSRSNAQNKGLVFKSASLITAPATDKQPGAQYEFKSVARGVNAIVSIDNVVGGAEVKKIDDDSGGLGYLDAFQPEIKIPSGTGSPYVEFTIRFVDSLTGLSRIMGSVQATTLDLDGNATVKETSEVSMGGGTATFMSTTLDISVVQLLLNKFKAVNLLGIERNNIDTSALGNMYTVSNSGISSFKVKFGANTLLGNNTNRQYSMYMKGFYYSSAITLPVNLVSFTATLKNAGSELKWVTEGEKNVSHFTVEKSPDGRNYSEAALVFAFGNTNDKKEYSFVDPLNLNQAAVIHYRLRIADVDGKVDYSPVRIIRTGKNTSRQLGIITFPNPVRDQLRITLPNEWQGKHVVIELININGQRSKRIEIRSSSQTELLDVSRETPGLTLVKAVCGDEKAEQKIIIAANR